MDLGELLRARKVIVCVGSGGVGKTTVSAAIALEAAMRGQTVCVLTIDPAKRLADALGLETLGNVATRVEPARFDEAGIPRPAGQLWALMLDTKRTWDDLVVRFAQSDAQARRILANHYYQQISAALAGSQEFMAMEKLYELHESGQFDLLVLDTPPTRHALDFLDAPRKMMGFMDERVLKAFVAPSLMAGRLGLGFLRSSTLWMFKTLERITGFEVLKDISEFIDSFSGMHAGFRDRAGAVEELLRAPSSTFVLVTSPNPLTVDEAVYFHGKLGEYRMPFGGFVVNRVHEDALAGTGAAEAWQAMRAAPEEILRHLGEPADAGLAGRIADHLERVQALAGLDAQQLARLERSCPGAPFFLTVPAFGNDIHDLSGLRWMDRSLFPEAAEPPVPR